MEADKPIPMWAVKAVMAPPTVLGAGFCIDDLARLLVATREAALREAARETGDRQDEQDILALIACEPDTHKCATCGSVRAWTVADGSSHVHAESCPHHVAPPPPPPEIPWVRIS